MSDKLTDNEIIKALECCSVDSPLSRKCSKCPNFQQKIGCSFRLMAMSLDLINRQQKEIKEWKIVVENCQMQHEKDKAEIERLNGCVKSEDEVRAIMKAQMEPMVKEATNDLIDRVGKMAKAEAVIDFAEILKKELNNMVRINYGDVDYFLVSLNFIDELVNERLRDVK